MNNNKNNVTIEPMYETEEGLEFIPNPDDHEFIKKQCEEGIFKMAFRLHSVDCAEIYAVFNNDKWTNHYDLYRYICLRRNANEELHQLLIEGEFDIGIAKIPPIYTWSTTLVLTFTIPLEFSPCFFLSRK